jgi:hypothetical protein
MYGVTVINTTFIRGNQSYQLQLELLSTPIVCFFEFSSLF